MPGRHVHLDPIGGLAGDMFAAAMIDAFPEHAAAVVAAAGSLAGVACRVAPHRDRVLTGHRFVVGEPSHHHDHAHHHTAWRDICARLADSSLPPGVRQHATGIFSHLAEAEGRVHGIAAEAVTFHEVGSADSIADIVAAACLIDAMGEATWSVGALPLGGGRVRTAHGVMPVPAPATALLLEGFETIDDGVAGERVTPTGAAILRHLGCSSRAGRSGRVSRSGIGFGTRELPGLSNVLRVLAFDLAEADAEAKDRPGSTHRDLAVICFEVDDQSAEDLAAGLDRLRALDGVHDVLQMPAFGKKGRMATHVQLLARPDALEAAVAACFAETTTIGLRTHHVRGHALPRETSEVTVDGVTLRVKTVERPGGRTSKAEADDALHGADHAARVRLRRRAEHLAQADD